MWSSRRKSCKTMPIRLRMSAISFLPSSEMSRPNKLTSPRVGRSDRNNSFSSDVLPAPGRPGEELEGMGRDQETEVAQDLRPQSVSQPDIFEPNQRSAPLGSGWEGCREGLATDRFCVRYGFRFVNGRLVALVCHKSDQLRHGGERLHAHHLPPLYNVLRHQTGDPRRGRANRALCPLQGNLAGAAGGCGRAGHGGGGPRLPAGGRLRLGRGRRLRPAHPGRGKPVDRRRLAIRGGRRRNRARKTGSPWSATPPRRRKPRRAAPGSAACCNGSSGRAARAAGPSAA